MHLLPNRKRLMDTVKMIAYRAETSMAGILKSETIDMPAAAGCCRICMQQRQTFCLIQKIKF
ncbi:hypothetical protein [uncultured Desulfobacter sp.]|uniref:hypothetical protein n=1 Tax=uncultured Desulfobacter sp. TaxID=240139 RepID=UPI00374A8800